MAANLTTPPVVELPKGGGAIRGIGEKFGTNLVTGAGTMTVPIATSPGRGGFGPQLSLSYDSGTGNGPFGFGWSLSLPAITRKVDTGFPQYLDARESDVFILSGTEDLVPMLRTDSSRFADTDSAPGFTIYRYRPRVEGLFARIERWTETATGVIHWRSISRDNVTTLYGKDNNSRIFDPAELDLDHPTRIFTWLICETYDDRGNAVVYEYAAEDDAGVDLLQTNEGNRIRTANRYLKRIRYGNVESRLVRTDLSTAEWMFEVVFDYDEGHITDEAVDAAHEMTLQATPHPAHPWTCRDDVFSSYRSGFEARTYRRCRRVLMFHHITSLPNGEAGYDGLVRSTDFTYAAGGSDTPGPLYSFLVSVSQSGYAPQDDRYLKRSLPPLEFEYSRVEVQHAVEEVTPESLQNLPSGLAGDAYQWTDLHGEGAPGILTEQAGAWFYARNLSAANATAVPGDPAAAARFAAIELVAERPNVSLAGGQAQILDLAGDGLPDVVVFDGPLPGLYEHDAEEGWEPFRPFTQRLDRTLADPSVRFIDIDGDGHADVLISDEAAFVWHRSLGEAGFGPAVRLAHCDDEERFPRLVFSGDTECVFLADLSGDGMTDLVQITKREICYWPNVGYGRFGPRVTMDNAPRLDELGEFDHRLIRLADIDGTGTTDLIYLHPCGVRIYFNRSGNAWSDALILPAFPPIHDLADITAVDLLSNGTACLTWSSPLTDDRRRPMRYVNLMGGGKPHLLIAVKNNLGVETRLQYAPSTKFYLQDRLEGRPWITRLPFPVHVVEKVAVTDRWRGTTFTTRYSYHHGYYDGEEREFHGFGRVEQIDVEDYGKFASENSSSPYITSELTLCQPPVLTITWHHTGAYVNRREVLGHYREEYFPTWYAAACGDGSLPGGFREKPLPEPDLEALDLSSQEWREALRACKGLILRQEVYELDPAAASASARDANEQRRVRLFSAAEHNCRIDMLQECGHNPHAVFLITESEAITYHYEMDLKAANVVPDPRIMHALNLRVDDLGNVQQAVSVVYGRLGTYSDAAVPADAGRLVRSLQAEAHLAYTETRYTGDALEDGHYRLRLPYEVLTYELGGIRPKVAASPDPVDDLYFTLDELRNYRLSDRYQGGPTAVADVSYHRLLSGAAPERRLVEHSRALFFKPSLDGPELPGKLNHLALPYERHALALTPELLQAVFGPRLDALVLARLVDRAASGYLLADGQHWQTSGVAGFSPEAADHFYLPERYIDPFGKVTRLEYGPRELFVRLSEDPLRNRTEVSRFDYRTLAPSRVADMNGNLSEVRFDALGMIVALAVLGKGDEADNLNGFGADGAGAAALNPDRLERAAFFAGQDYTATAGRALLRNTTSRHLYYFGETVVNGRILWGAHPACAAGIVRERHARADPNSPVQAAFEYSDGSGNLIVTKVQAEPEQPDGPLRWVASGKVILNNKGKRVKRYEPYFCAPGTGHRYEEPDAVGVTTVISYDATGRPIRSDAPDGSYSRVEFSPWHVVSFDRNDTLGELGNKWFARLSASAKREERQAARHAVAHAGTPATTLLDSLGREVVNLAHNLVARDNGPSPKKYVTFTRFDTEGKPLWVQDARGNRVMQHVLPPLPEGTHPFDDPQNVRPHDVVPGYDIAGNLLFGHSMDGGDRWLLNDAAGQPMYSWNSRGFIAETTFDELRRATAMFVIAGGAWTLDGRSRDPNGPPAAPVQVEKRVYGENHPQATERNLRGKLIEHGDGAGKVSIERYDFKGNALGSRRELAVDYKAIPDWSQPVALDPEALTTVAEFDALNRPTALTTPDRSVYRPMYNEANLLDGVDVNLRGELVNNQPKWTPFVANIDYDAKGQRQRIVYANGAVTAYNYDANTYRLIRLQTTRPPTAGSLAAIFTQVGLLQDLRYVYDPVGNITHIADAALRTFVHDGQVVEATSQYTYDPLYRLTAASGREHVGQTGFDFKPADLNYRDHPFAGHRVHMNDLQGLRGYVETYRYDAVGNLMHTGHHGGTNVEQPGAVLWNRRYQYALDSNRLLATSIPGDPDGLSEYVAAGGYSHTYGYDEHGSMVRMAHLPLMRWNFRDHLAASRRQVANNGGAVTTYYTYDAAGQRVRKVTEGPTGARQSERTYAGGWEIYREYTGQAVSLERETLHVMDDQQRIALVETKSAHAIGTPVIRYQLGDHLGSASLELDTSAAVLNYEEYHPYGTMAFRATGAAEVSLKRYLYTGKERDEETGLAYHGARYYAPWLGRWASCDPSDVRDGPNRYMSVRDNPIRYVDENGKQAGTPTLVAAPIDAAVPATPGPGTGPGAPSMPMNDISPTPNRIINFIEPGTRPSGPFSSSGASRTAGLGTGLGVGILTGPILVGASMFLAVMTWHSNKPHTNEYVDPNTGERHVFKTYEARDAYINQEQKEKLQAPSTQQSADSADAPGSLPKGEEYKDPFPQDAPRIAPGAPDGHEKQFPGTESDGESLQARHLTVDERIEIMQQINQGKQLTRDMRGLLRGEARQIWLERSQGKGPQPGSDWQLHHVITLEWAHKFPGVYPNSPSNLALMRTVDHQKLHSILNKGFKEYEVTPKLLTDMSNNFKEGWKNYYRQVK